MYQSPPQRHSGFRHRNAVIIAAIIALVVGVSVTMTNVSNAAGRRGNRTGGQVKCTQVQGANSPTGRNLTATRQNGRVVRNHWGDGQELPAACQANNTLAGGQNQQAEPVVACPDVAAALPQVPQQVKAQVDQITAFMKAQQADANARLKASAGQSQNFINNNILAPLNNQRAALINQMANLMGQQIQNAQQLATCQLKAGKKKNGGQQNGGQQNGGQQNGGQQNGGQQNGGQQNGGQQGGGLQALADKCQGGSNLQPHDGFQNGNRCVDTEMGEVGTEDKNPSLLITDFPQQVGVNQPFQLRVSTRNLIRDRFLAAGQGGYYIEMSLLNEQGLVRGHFHTACRMLNNTNSAPDPAPAPAFFVATEDGGGGGGADEIVIEVPGLPQQGTAQCASWAGDGSHRLPMMQRANQTPAFDAVRINVQ